jgi:hypothetical protein
MQHPKNAMVPGVSSGFVFAFGFYISLSLSSSSVSYRKSYSRRLLYSKVFGTQNEKLY